MLKRKPKKVNYVEKRDTALSQFVRLSAANETGYVKCVTCGECYHWKNMHNGHFISRGNMSVRYDLMNCHPQCVKCNVWKSGNIEMYLPYMIETYGPDAVDELGQRSHTITQWTEADHKQEIKYYTQEVKKLKKWIQ